MIVRHNSLTTDGQNSALSVSRQRMDISPGLYAKSGGDDALCLVISGKKRAQLRELDMEATQAQNDISRTQAAEGDLSVIYEKLARIRELVAHSAEYTVTDGDREIINKEINQLINQIDKIAPSSEFDCEVSHALGRLPATTAPVGGAFGWGGLEWLRQYIVNEAAPRIMSVLLNTFGYMEWFRGSNIQTGMAQQGGTGGYAQWGASNWNAALGSWMTMNLRISMGTGFANASGFLSEQHRVNFYGLLAHELMHAVMFVTNHNIMTTSAGTTQAPIWFQEGMAEVIGGHMNWSLMGGLRPENATSASIRTVLGQLGNPTAVGEYGAAYLAVMYMGWRANGSGEINSANISEGLNLILGYNANGMSLNAALNLHTGFATMAAFQAYVRAGGQEIVDFVHALLAEIGPTGAGSLLGELGDRFPKPLDFYISERDFMRISSTPTGSHGWASNTVPGGYRLTINGGSLTASGNRVHSTFHANYRLSNGQAVRNVDGTVDISFDSTRVNAANEGEFFFVVRQAGASPATTRDFNTAVAGTVFSSTTGEFTLDNLTGGEYEIFVVVRDVYGNLSQVLNISVAEDEFDPDRPNIYSASAVREAEDQARISFNSDRPGTFSYLVVDESDPSPSAIDIMTSGNSGAAVTGSNSFNISGNDLDGRRVYIIVEDEAGQSNVIRVSVPEFVPPPPVLSNVTGTRTDETTGQVRFNSSQTGTILYVITAANDPSMPDADYIRANGASGGNAVVGQNTINIAGLDPEAYRVHVIVVDDIDQNSGVIRATIPAFTPHQPPPPLPPRPPQSSVSSTTPPRQFGLFFQIGANAGQGSWLTIGGMDSRTLGLRDARGNILIDVRRDSGRHITSQLNLLDDAMSYVNSERSKLGAMQNRLESTIKSLDISSENLADAESRIRDADMAKEIIRFNQANALKQAAILMLVHARQEPERVLQLL